MTKQKKKRIGLNMKPRTGHTEATQAVPDLSPEVGQETLETGAVQGEIGDIPSAESAPKTPETVTTLEPEIVQNLDSKHVAGVTSEDASGLADLLKKSADQNPATPLLIAARDGKVEELYQMVGERPDGTFGMVLTIREGMIEPIRQQSGYDKQTPEEWVSERFGDYLDQWWAPPQGR